MGRAIATHGGGLLSASGLRHRRPLSRCRHGLPSGVGRRITCNDWFVFLSETASVRLFSLISRELVSANTAKAVVNVASLVLDARRA